MRTRAGILLALAIACLAPAGARAGEPDRDEAAVSVGMTREEFTRVTQLGAREILSDVGDVVALTSQEREIEFERYVFTRPSGVQPARLWQITIAYRMPADRARFNRVAGELVERYGAVTQSTSRPGDTDQPPFERRVWASNTRVVTLVGCPDGSTTDEASRMQITVVDRTLQRLGLAQRRPPHPQTH